MTAYPLIVPVKGKYLTPVSTSNTAEYVMENHSVSLVEHLVEEGYGRYKYRYRLHTQEPNRFEATLEYDIGCPRCQGHLRLCGRPLDAYDHGLYKCPICEKGTWRT